MMKIILYTILFIKFLYKCIEVVLYIKHQNKTKKILSFIVLFKEVVHSIKIIFPLVKSSIIVL